MAKPKLKLLGESIQHDYLRVLVKNTGRSEAKGCYGKITIEHKKQDVLPSCKSNLPSTRSIYDIPVFIDPSYYSKVERMNLCWSVSRPQNPHKLDIGRGVEETLDILCLRLHSDTEPFFEVPSEQGWGEKDEAGHVLRKSRVLLKAQEYEGRVLIGCSNIKPFEKNFKITFNATNNEVHLALTA